MTYEDTELKNSDETYMSETSDELKVEDGKQRCADDKGTMGE